LTHAERQTDMKHYCKCDGSVKEIFSHDIYLFIIEYYVLLHPRIIKCLFVILFRELGKIQLWPTLYTKSE